MKKNILTLLSVLLIIPLSDVYSGNYTKNNKNPFTSELFGFLPKGGSSTVSYPSQGLYLNVIPSFAGIKNKDIADDENWTVKNGMGLSIEAGYFTKFKPLIGLGFGFSYSSYSTEISADPQNINYPDEDFDNDSFTMNVETSGISEKLKISYLDIPVFVEFGNPNIDKIGFYGRIGVKISFPLSQTFTPSGLASYEGYYQQFHVTLYDIPELGFYDNKSFYDNTETGLNSINVSALLSGGVTFPLSNYLILRAGANANFGLMEISGQKADDYDNSKYDGNYSKLLENPNAKTTTQSFGLELGIIYNLRLY
ncbi:MAG: hypothetical protein B6D61_07190 [Bacteroidetes bacterium 4484_249]|nr:MAG: hypothetical protein B6D61_07190 [Bacteroidetes bacterium 4484_249]